MFRGWRFAAALALLCLVSPALSMDMGGMAHGGQEGGETAPMAESAPMGGMQMGGMGSGNMSDPCYADPSAPACAFFTRSDEDWEDDIEMLCAAMPFMIGCSLWDQCLNGTATGEYCELSSLAGNICVDMPGMKGCEAWNALCGTNATASVVEQCEAPGPVPGVVTTFVAKEGLESLCSTHCMDGCPDCETGKGWDTCTDPLLVLARMCYEMPDMPECQDPPYGTGIVSMCEDAAVAASFPMVCTSPPVPAAKCL